MTWQPGDRPLEPRHATRSTVMASRGVIATSQPLASAAGLRVLMEGGNAVDAAVTAAATLAVVEPTMTGLGGDLFAILHNGRTGTIHALNASGRAPRGASIERLEADLGPVGTMPSTGPLSISVPGAVDGWAELLKQHGTVSLARALEPATTYAREGYAVSEIVAHQWQTVEPLLAAEPQSATLLLPNGRAPRAGDIFHNPLLADTLDMLARHGPNAFYRGQIADALTADLHEAGSWIQGEDLAQHRSDWVDPIRTTFRGRELLELPPNTQGLTAIEIVNLIGCEDLERLEHNTPAYVHHLVESVRIAFADRAAHLADPVAVPPDIIEHLVSNGYALARRDEIDPDRAAPTYQAWRARRPTIAPASGIGDTVYLAAADDRGNVVSLIQSLFGAFGSGIVSPRTGIVLQNRAALFALDPTHPNCLDGDKRPLHTLIPALVLEQDAPALAFGVMGGDMQAQGHAQVLANLFAFGMTLQEAGEAARARWTGTGVALESGIDKGVAVELGTRGHRVSDERDGFGGFQGVLIDRTRGVLHGGSDPRKDGLAIGW